MEGIRWKSDKEKYEKYLEYRKRKVAALKKNAKLEKLTRKEIERMMRENQTL